MNSPLSPGTTLSEPSKPSVRSESLITSNEQISPENTYPEDIQRIILNLREQNIILNAAEKRGRMQRTRKLLRDEIATQGLNPDIVNDENQRSQLINQIIQEHPEIKGNKDFSRFLKGHTALPSERTNAYVGKFLNKITQQEAPDAKIEGLFAREGIQVAKNDIALLKHYLQKLITNTIAIETAETVKIDGNLMLNDTSLADADLEKELNAISSVDIRILNIEEVIGPFIQALEDSNLEQTQFLLLGGGSSIPMDLIQQRRPDLAEKVLKNTISLRPIRTLNEKGEPNISLTEEDQAKLQKIDKPNICILEDVVASGKTISTIHQALSQAGMKPARLDVIALIVAQRKNQVIPPSTRIQAGARIVRTDGSHPPINTLSTVIAQHRKGRLAVGTLEQKGYLSSIDLLSTLKKMIDEKRLSDQVPYGNLVYGLQLRQILRLFDVREDEAEVILDALHNLQNKQVVFCDLDGTIDQPFTASLPESLKRLEDRINESGNLALVLHSDSSTQFLKNLPGPYKILISEQGASATYTSDKNKDGISLPNGGPDLANQVAALRDSIICDLMKEISCSTAIIPAQNAGEIMQDGKHSLKPGKNKAIFINTGRKNSLGFFVRAVAPDGKFIGSDGDLLNQLEAVINKNLNSNGFGNLESRFYPEVGSILVHDLSINKTKAVKNILDLLNLLEIPVQNIHMIGNDTADFINDPRVINCAVANATDQLKKRARIVSQKPLVEGVIEILEQIG